MVTSKSRINAYVDDASYDAFKKWCNGHGCSDSKGVELLIKEYLLGVTQNQVTGNVPNNLVTQESFEAAIADQDLQIKRLQGLIFNAPIDLAIENERPFFTLDERVKYLELELGELKKGQRNRVTAIALQTIPVDDVELISPEPLPLLDALETATDTAIAVETLPDNDNLAITEILPSQDAQISQETSNQDDSPITDTESLQSRFDAGEWIFAKDYADLLKTTPNALDKRRKNESLPKDIETKKEGRFRKYRKLKTAIAE